MTADELQNENKELRAEFSAMVDRELATRAQLRTCQDQLARFAPWDDAEDLRRQAEHDRHDRDTFLQQLVEVRAWLRNALDLDARGATDWSGLARILKRQPDAAPPAAAHAPTWSEADQDAVAAVLAAHWPDDNLDPEERDDEAQNLADMVLRTLYYRQLDEREQPDERTRLDHGRLMLQLIAVREWAASQVSGERVAWEKLDRILSGNPDAAPDPDYLRARREARIEVINEVAQLIHSSEAPVSRLVEWIYSETGRSVLQSIDLTHVGAEIHEKWKREDDEHAAAVDDPEGWTDYKLEKKP